ncbi:MAG: cytochrome c nitrite reductase small subunit [Chloroflexota bacterium]
MTRFPLIVSIAAAAIALAVFAVVTDTPAMMGSAPEACANCHVMDAAYENWYHAPHEKWTECVDCHLPHENVFAYYFAKGKTGMHDVYVFSTGQTPALIRANEDTKEWVQGNCIRCHADAVEGILMGAQPFERNCWDCHRDVAHGQRGISIAPNQDSSLYEGE